MKADVRTESGVQALLEEIAAAYSAKDPQRLLATLAPDSDVSIIGTGAHERAFGVNDIATMFERDFTQVDAVRLELCAYSVSAAGPVAWVVGEMAFHATVAGQTMTFPCRLSMVAEQRDGRWLVQHMHASVPNADQAAGQSFPGED